MLSLSLKKQQTCFQTDIYGKGQQKNNSRYIYYQKMLVRYYVPLISS
jgi:hypothetical protein